MTFGATRWTRGEERMRRRRLQSRASHCRGAIRDPLHSYGLKVNRIVRVIRVHDTRHVSIFNECACATCLCACMGCGARCVLRLRVRGACMRCLQGGSGCRAPCGTARRCAWKMDQVSARSRPLDRAGLPTPRQALRDGGRGDRGRTRTHSNAAHATPQGQSLILLYFGNNSKCEPVRTIHSEISAGRDMRPMHHASTRPTVA